ncbi:MAG TPA: multiheme c-type cytochrome [Blastocatellia bacterium]|nr:multiheme c-type cytochrome [Blastocatellia bacterium]
MKKIALAGLMAAAFLTAYFSLIRKQTAPPDSSSSAVANGQTLPARYTGPGACSSTACHGAVTPASDRESRIQQNEYTTWVLKDKHAKAYQVLLTERSQLIARNLGMEEKPEQSRRCLPCHALSVPPERRARTFDLSDGVSCESCHGPAEKWLGPHTTRDWTHEQSVAVGMYDTRHPVRRAELCLSCHLGDEEKTVNHELIAAGHPDLIFELEYFTLAMPPHWRSEDNWKGARPKREAFGLTAWAVGQAVALRETLNQLARRVSSPTWPEFAEYDCYSCHHDLREPSWRQRRGYSHAPGRPPWNTARAAVFRHLVRVIAPDEGRTLDEQIATLSMLLSQPTVEREKISAAIKQTQAIVERILGKIVTTPLTDQVTQALLRNISGDGERIGFAGVRAAEQAVMSLDALSSTRGVAVEPAVQSALTRLLDYLERPERFEPTRFATLMGELHQHFR